MFDCKASMDNTGRGSASKYLYGIVWSSQCASNNNALCSRQANKCQLHGKWYKLPSTSCINSQLDPFFLLLHLLHFHNRTSTHTHQRANTRTCREFIVSTREARILGNNPSLIFPTEDQEQKRYLSPINKSCSKRQQTLSTETYSSGKFSCLFLSPRANVDMPLS